MDCFSFFYLERRYSFAKGVCSEMNASNFQGIYDKLLRDFAQDSFYPTDIVLLDTAHGQRDMRQAAFFGQGNSPVGEPSVRLDDLIHHRFRGQQYYVNNYFRHCSGLDWAG